MLSALLVIIAAALVTAGASRFMWWACNRSPVWSMTAGALLALLALAGGVILAWLMTQAMYGR